MQKLLFINHQINFFYTKNGVLQNLKNVLQYPWSII